MMPPNTASAPPIPSPKTLCPTSTAARGTKMAVKTMIEAVRDALYEEMARDPSIIVLGEDVGVSGGVFRATEGLYKEFGEYRAIDTPLAESSIVGIAIGASLNGIRPVAEIQFAD